MLTQGGVWILIEGVKEKDTYRNTNDFFGKIKRPLEEQVGDTVVVWGLCLGVVWKLLNSSDESIFHVYSQEEN